ncbi:MAG: NADP oxidoreductase [Planctomycetota bacterium]|nr:NADP oxidoreductase [Planctomycetota bacterium]
MSKPRLATAWLDGCSGCHMSLLDMDERLIEIAQQVEVVCGPYVDIKEFPENVDIALVEGAVSSEEDLHRIKKIRERSKLLICMGDCALTANVPSMRNAWEPDEVLARAYIENATMQQQIPRTSVPRLLNRARPVHEIVRVDIFIPGCPPSADVLYFALTELLAGRVPDLSSRTRFGA